MWRPYDAGSGHNNARDALEFFCLAEKALRDDSQQTPGKLFYALIKQKSREFVTQEIENRALLRLPSHERQALVDRAARSSALPAPVPKDVQETLFGRDVGYHHGIMAQCFLPQKPPPPSSNSKGSRVESTTGAVALGRWGVAVAGGFRDAGASIHAMAPFPVAAHRTGRADFPHPALGRDHAFAHGRLALRCARWVRPRSLHRSSSGKRTNFPDRILCFRHSHRRSRWVACRSTAA